MHNSHSQPNKVKYSSWPGSKVKKLCFIFHLAKSCQKITPIFKSSIIFMNCEKIVFWLNAVLFQCDNDNQVFYGYHFSMDNVEKVEREVTKAGINNCCFWNKWTIVWCQSFQWNDFFNIMRVSRQSHLWVCKNWPSYSASQHFCTCDLFCKFTVTSAPW